jgi:hypothetical protein
VPHHHLVRVGVIGHVGRFAAVDAVAYPRGTRVVCRTRRGLEVGEVLSPVPARASADGPLLRRLSVQDELLLARLDKHKDKAIRACTSLLAERGFSTALLDVETLFDGRTVYFYFLGNVTPELEAVTAELGEVYESKARLREFADLLQTGCGPGCGTEEATGCSTGTCTTCVVAKACGTRVRE